MQLNTVIFDMDGLLIDSEPHWQDAAFEYFSQYHHIQMTPALYHTTTGLRTREFLEYWFDWYKLDHTHLAFAEDAVIKSVIQRIRDKAKVMAGVFHIIDYFKSKHWKIGIATSSPLELADVVISKLGIRDSLQTIASAKHLPFGKPHPMVYMDCAEQLGSKPQQCLCFEDSFNGMIAAKAAKMKCVVVPAAAEVNEARWAAADLKISSLQNFNDLLLQRL